MRKWIIILAGIIVAIAALRRRQLAEGFSAMFGGEERSATPTPVSRPDQPQIIVDAVVAPIRYADLSLRASGTVAEVLVQEGETVEAEPTPRPSRQ